jgi:hypothetical protein
MLLTDGEQTSTVELAGNTVTLGLRGKGSRFTVTRPEGTTLVRTNVARNHRNGRAELVYGSASSRVMEYRVTAWPVYDPTALRGAPGARATTGPVIGFDGAFLLVEESGDHRSEIRALDGRLLWSRAGRGDSRYDLRSLERGQGVHVLTVTSAAGRTVRKFFR